MVDYDVVIRCKNEMEWLPRVIQSLQSQTIKPSKIILVDNSSSDGSQEFAMEQGCTVVQYDKEDFNYSYALNLGIQNTSASSTLILSAHCELVTNNSIELMLEIFKEYKNVAGIFGRQIPSVNSNPFDTRDLLTVFGRERIIYSKYPFFHNAFSLIDRHAWEEIEFDEGYNGIEDRVWAKAQTALGNIIIYEPDAIVFHEHGLNQGTTSARAERVCRALKNLHEDDMFQWPSFHEDK